LTQVWFETVKDGPSCKRLHNLRGSGRHVYIVNVQRLPFSLSTTMSNPVHDVHSSSRRDSPITDYCSLRPPPVILENLRSNLYFSKDTYRSQREEISRCTQDHFHQIRELESQIRQLELRVQVLESWSAQYDSLSSPIRQLPPELLTEIFSYLDLKLGIDKYGLNQVTTTSLQLSHVCASWKSYLTRSSNLWSSISLNIPTVYSLKDANALLRLYLQRSQTAPLSLRISDWTSKHVITKDDIAWVSGLPFPEDPDLPGSTWEHHTIPFRFSGEVGELLNQLLDAAARWKSVDFGVDWTFFSILNETWALYINPGDYIPTLSFPLLEHLGLSYIPSWRCTTVPYLHLFNANTAPRLRSLDLPKCANNMLNEATLPFVQLTKVKIEGLDESGAFLLSCCPRLENLVVVAFDHITPTSPSSGSITNRTIESLSLRGPEATECLDFVDLPCLSRLTLHRSTDFPPPGLFSCIQKSSCSITELHLSEVTLYKPSERAMEVFRLMPELKVLGIRERAYAIEPAFMRALSFAGGDSSPLFPNLEHLCLEIRSGDLLESILFLVQSRSTPHTSTLAEAAANQSARVEPTLTLLKKFSFRVRVTTWKRSEEFRIFERNVRELSRRGRLEVDITVMSYF
jgi:hypothetical protein